jgi:hypothetical protein
MIELDMFKTWAEDLGLRVKGEPATAELYVSLPISGAARFTIRRDRKDVWSITHQRPLAASILNSNWGIGAQSETPISLLTKAVRRLATGFPLLQAEVIPRGSDVVIEFNVPVYAEALTQQAFVLSLSSVMKAVEAFDLLAAQRAEQIAALKEFEVKEAELKKRNEEDLAKLMAPGPEQSPRPKQISKNNCPHCGIDLPANAIFCASCGQRITAAAASVPFTQASPQRRCPRCGQPVVSNKKFCTSCGATLN